MSVRVQLSPGQSHALPGHVTHTCCDVTHTCHHVLLLSGFHPCSVSHGTGKLNINIIYSKCHKCKVETGLAVVLIYDLRGELLNFRLWKAVEGFCDGFSILLGGCFQYKDVMNYSQFSNSVTGVIQRIICYKTWTPFVDL